jgi:biopolymer transport protein ExbD
VLLVFFILTTTVAALQKRIEAPSVEEGKVKVPVLTKDEVAEQMIHVKAMMEDGQPVIRVEEEIVEPHRLIIALKKWVKQKRRSDLLLEHDDNVPHEIVVKIIDSAKAAEMTRVRLVVP